MLANKDVKFVCSNVREPYLLEKISLQDILTVNNNPTAGDLIIVKVLDDSKGYSTAENSYGRPVQLYKGDIFIGVLGFRRSGTNNVGIVPEACLQQGDEIQLLSQGGIIGHIICPDNNQRNGSALSLSVIGFVKNNKGDILNIQELKQIPSNTDKPLNPKNKPVYFIFGTSAEAGKTSLCVNMIRHLKEDFNQVFCSKAGGTGRYKDTLAFIDAGAISKDFVDLGYGTTYSMEKREYQQALTDLYNYAIESSDVAVFEIGGDLIESYAVYALEFAQMLGVNVMLVVNDAMGAMTGMEITNYKENKEKIAIATFKQNPFALAQRLNIPTVINTASGEDIEMYLKTTLTKKIEKDLV